MSKIIRMPAAKLRTAFRLLLLMIICAAPAVSRGELRLPSIFGNHMVLQREAQVPVWGWAAPGEKITVTFAGQTKTVTTDENGKWQVALDAMPASAKPGELIVTGSSKVTFKDVLVGEVWLASGQSNMEWSLRQIAKSEQQFAAGIKDAGLIRAFQDGHHVSSLLLSDSSGAWRHGDNIVKSRSNSAVGFFFAYELHKQLGVPVAFLDLNWGGRRIELFIPDEGYAAKGLKHQSASEANKAKFVAAIERYKAQLDQVALDAKRGIFRNLPAAPNLGNAANGIYNAMIAPVTPYAIRGAIWYQGESNRGSSDYFEKIGALSAGWSKVFGVKDIPLYMVQIAPFNYDRNDQLNSTLSNNIWAAQYRAEAEVAGVGVVPIHDTKIPLKNIHPPFKKPVGDRLAEMALARIYGKKEARSHAPRLKKVKRSGDHIAVTFDHAQGLKTADGKAPSHFELSDNGKKFAAAEAKIEGEKVLVTIPAGTSPKFIRMGWYEDVLPNLQAEDGWPVMQFPGTAIE